MKRWPILMLLVSAAAWAEPTVQAHTCPNGLTVLVVEKHELPLVTVEITAKNGSMTEPPEYNGLSHLYEHMFFKANRALPSQEAYMARGRELGMVWNGTTNTERVNYFFTTTSDHFADTMVFMRDAVVSPLFDEKELERERVVVTGEIDRNEANPFYHFNHQLDQHVWWKYPTRKDPLGKRETVLSATQAKMQTIQQRYYVPNNSALVVTGDVSAADVFAQADRLYADWKKAEDPFIKFPLVQHPPLPHSEVVLVEQPVRTFDGRFVWHGPSTVGADVASTYAADLLTTAISEPSSKFQKALVDSGACVGVGLSWETQMNTGPIDLSFEAAPDKVDACVSAIVAELPKMRSPDYLSADELANARHRMAVDQVMERESSVGLAHSLTFWWTSAGLDYYLGYIGNVNKVTPADIAHYLDTYVIAKPYVFGGMLSPEMAAKGFDQAHFEKLLSIPHLPPPSSPPEASR